MINKNVRMMILGFENEEEKSDSSSSSALKFCRVSLFA